MREAIARQWEDGGFTAALGSLGFDAATVDRLVTAFRHSRSGEQHYGTGFLAARLFDLVFLAAWLDRYHVRRA
jgi:hypothetical protein